MDLKAFEYEVVNGVGHITLNQPDIGNPINHAFCEEFCQLSIECGEDPNVRAVLIDANGLNFSVGGDLKTFRHDHSALPRAFKEMTATLHMGVSRFARMDAPVIVAADNFVVGGGAALIAGADFVITTERAKFYAAFAAIGLCGDTGMSYFLPRRVGSRKAAEFLILNKQWSAQEALANGLVTEIVEPETLAEHSMAMAAQLAQGPTGVYGKMKRLMLSSYDNTLEAQLESEAIGMVECARTEDAWGAINAMLNREKAVFNNK